jgi:cell division protein FtsB
MRFTYAFAICILLFGLFGDDHGLRAMLQARRDARSLDARIVALRAENARLRRRVEALRSDPDAIEAAAREMLGLVRRDEIVVRYRPSTVR